MTKQQPNITVLDGHTLNPGDLSWAAVQAFGPTEVYDYTSPADIVPRASGAQVLLVNKAIISDAVMAALPELRLICVTATGYNNIDVRAARQRGIQVCNVAGYGMDSVAQHVLAMMLHFAIGLEAHHRSVQAGDWARQPHFCYTLRPVRELSGQVLGIYGFGQIGERVGQVAAALGMEVLAHTRTAPAVAPDWVRFVSLDELFEQSDYLSLHAPLTAENQGLVNKARLQQMKPSAVLINTARGGLLHEADLAHALAQGIIAGAALDVLATEPPAASHLLMGLPNCIITPHIAWAAQESRQRLLAKVVDNIELFLRGDLVGLEA